MYNIVIVEMRDHTQYERIYTVSKTKNQVRAIGKKLADKLMKWSVCYDDEPFILWLGRYCNGKVVYEAELLSND